MGRANGKASTAVKLRGLPDQVDLEVYSTVLADIDSFEDVRTYLNLRTEIDTDLDPILSHLATLSHLNMKAYEVYPETKSAVAIICAADINLNANILGNNEVFSWESYFNELLKSAGAKNFKDFRDELDESGFDNLAACYSTIPAFFKGEALRAKQEYVDKFGVSLPDESAGDAKPAILFADEIKDQYCLHLEGDVWNEDIPLNKIAKEINTIYYCKMLPFDNWDREAEAKRSEKAANKLMIQSLLDAINNPTLLERYYGQS